MIKKITNWYKRKRFKKTSNTLFIDSMGDADTVHNILIKNGYDVFSRFSKCGEPCTVSYSMGGAE